MTPWTAACQTSLSCAISQSLREFMSTQSVCHPAISSSTAPFSSCPQSFPASESFPVSRLFPSGGQVSALQHQPLSSEYSGLISVGYLELMNTLPRCSLRSKHHMHSFSNERHYWESGISPEIWGPSFILKPQLMHFQGC